MSLHTETDLYGKISFLLLAGGKGTRMGGVDKSALPYDEKRDFLEKILSETEGFKEIIISKNSLIPIEKLFDSERRALSKFESNEYISTSLDHQESSERKPSYHSTTMGGRTYKIVRDVFEDVGPLAGLYSGMMVSSSPYIFVTTCDTPNITKDFIEYILGYLSSDYDAVIIKDSEGRIHPLCGIYKKNLFNRVREQIEKNDFKILKVFQNLNVKILDFKHTDFNLNHILNNFNFLEELNSLNYLKKMKKKPKIFAISGIKNSGKTSLISKIIEEIKNRGESIAVIKHDGHDFSCDTPGTDTWKFRESGATGTLIFSETKFMMNRDINLFPPEVKFHGESIIDNQSILGKDSKIDDYYITNYLEYFQEYDYIILEGFKHSKYPKFEIVRKNISTESVAERENLLGIITDLDYIPGVERLEIFNLNDPTLTKKLLNFLDTLPTIQLNINKE